MLTEEFGRLRLYNTRREDKSKDIGEDVPGCWDLYSCIYLSLWLLHFQVWRVGEQVSGELNSKPTCLIAVAMSVEGLSTRKQHLYTQHQYSGQ